MFPEKTVLLRGNSVCEKLTNLQEFQKRSCMYYFATYYCTDQIVTAGRSYDFTFLVAFNQLLTPLIGLVGRRNYYTS